jgi:hypothetical protein
MKSSNIRPEKGAVQISYQTLWLNDVMPRLSQGNMAKCVTAYLLCISTLDGINFGFIIFYPIYWR